MKKSIKREDIKAGDLIRCEGFDGTDSAREYRAICDGEAIYNSARYYLLDRPFNPVWGTVVGYVCGPRSRAVYLPGVEGDSLPWLTRDGWMAHSTILEFMESSDPWVVIDGPDEGMEYV